MYINIFTVEPHYDGPYYNGQLKKIVIYRKISKECVSALLCANADGNHLLKTCLKQTQQNINYFFKPMNVSNQHEPGPSCSKD
jgi:hypothetical protein